MHPRTEKFINARMKLDIKQKTIKASKERNIRG